MRNEEYQVNLLLEKLTVEEKVMIKTAFSKQYGVSIGLTQEELSVMKLEMLITLGNILRGLLLTKEHVPDIKDAYDTSQSKNLPRKVQFGRLDHIDSEE